MTNAAEVIDRDHTSIVREAIADVEQRLAEDVARVVAAAEAADQDEVSEALDDAISDMKGYFGSLEANSVSDTEAEATIGIVEGWITDNVSNGTLEQRITGAMTIRSVDQLITAFG